MKKKIHNRRSIRLKGYDYSQAGLYFVTMCCQNRARLFGKIIDGKFITNPAGEMIDRWYSELENKFPKVKCLEMVIMPNHFHCVIEIIDQSDKSPIPTVEKSSTVGVDLSVHPPQSNQNSPTLGTIIQWFKTMTTNEYIRGVKNLNWQAFNKRVWQRDYFERIIRTEEDYIRIANYIVRNPKNWKEDNLFGE